MFKISRYIIHLSSIAHSYSFYCGNILPSYGNAKVWMWDIKERRAESVNRLHNCPRLLSQTPEQTFSVGVEEESNFVF